MAFYIVPIFGRLPLAVNSIWIKSFFVVHEVKVDGVVLRKADCPVKAGPAASVAGSGALLGDVKNESILITISANLMDFLGVSRSRSLMPDFLA